MNESDTEGAAVTEGHRTGTGAASADLKRAADRLFAEIYGRWTQSDNVWRNAWAFDTLLDYFAAADVDASACAEAALHALDPRKAGAWWDDFGWIGIAALRAAEQNIAPQRQFDFLKIAINAWAYMYGPGWSSTRTAIYPFTDVPGWKEYQPSHTPNIGAPNVWRDIGKTWRDASPEQIAERRPRYSPGGAWNSPITDARQPDPVVRYEGWSSYLNPVQNTVTNGLYAILALRIFQAARNPAFAGVFRESGLDVEACLGAWTDQIEWLERWLIETPDADESLLLRLGAGSLVRERVSTFHEANGRMLWDAAYSKTLLWTGDQGLLLGALREARAANLLVPEPKAFGLPAQIVQGVFEHGYAERSYGVIRGEFLLPWIGIGSSDPFAVPSPGNDDPDYQTGVGVFMRYLLQAYQAEPGLVDKYRSAIADSARKIATEGFGQDPRPGGACDAFTPMGGSTDQMTAYVNRLSVLLLAIAMGE